MAGPQGVQGYTTSGTVSANSGRTWTGTVTTSLKAKFTAKAAIGGPIAPELSAEWTVQNFAGTVTVYGTPQPDGDKVDVATFNPGVRIEGVSLEKQK